MQITIKSTRIIKAGFQSNGTTPYKWVSVMADDGSEKGTEYTTFDAAVLKLGPGSVIDIGDPATKEGKLSFKKVEKVITSKAAVATPVPGPNDGTRETSPEEWKEKQRIERASFEGQTAFKGILVLAGTEQFQVLRQSSDVLRTKLDKVLDEALDWASDHFKAANSDRGLADASKDIIESSTATAKKEELKQLGQSGEFKNKGELLTAAANAGISSRDVLAATGSDSLNNIIDLNEAWIAVKTKFPAKFEAAG